MQVIKQEVGSVSQDWSDLDLRIKIQENSWRLLKDKKNKKMLQV